MLHFLLVANMVNYVVMGLYFCCSGSNCGFVFSSIVLVNKKTQVEFTKFELYES